MELVGRRAAGWPLRLTAVAAALWAGLLPGAALEAFPGAVGHGKETVGGRGGRIIEVTSLSNRGPGTLRACAESLGPRVCVFRVGGTVILDGSLRIEGAERSHLSILGQTAPGGGISVTVTPVDGLRWATPVVIKRTEEVLIRHLRSRPTFQPTTKNVDAFTVEDARRVYLDHISGAWATDENFNAHGTVTDLTVAYGLFGEGLMPHSKCALLASDPTGPQDITFWRTFCTSNTDRNPDNNHFGGSCVEVVDNIFFNARSEWAEVFSSFPGGTPVSIVGNYFKAGPSTLSRTHAINWNPAGAVSTPRIYASQNAIWEASGTVVEAVAPDTLDFLVDEAPCPLAVPTLGSPDLAYKDVRRNAGAFPRDEIDDRFVRDLGDRGKAGKGQIRTEPGALPDIASGTPYRDDDRDGMADAVEASFGAVPGVFDPWEDGDGDGWPNLDAFTEWLSAERLAGRYPE